jgi:hypothetical protein
VDVDPLRLFKVISLVWYFPGIHPLILNSPAVQLVLIVVVFEAAETFIDSVQLLPYEGKGYLCRHEELKMILVEGIDVLLAVESSVHDKLYL